MIAERSKLCEIWRMWDLYREEFCKCAVLFEEGRNGISDEDRLGSFPMASRPKIVDSVNAHISADRKITIEDISEQPEISVDTTHKIVSDGLDFSNINGGWVPQNVDARAQELEKLSVSEVHIFLTVQIWPPDLDLFGPLQEFQRGTKFSVDEMKSKKRSPMISLLKEYKSFFFDGSRNNNDLWLYKYFYLERLSSRLGLKNTQIVSLQKGKKNSKRVPWIWH